MDENDKYKQLSRELVVEEYPEGVILPQKMEKGAPMWGLGGVCDRNNQFVKISFYDGGWAKHGGFYHWNCEDHSEYEVVYAGVFGMHWGHFLIDQTNRLWAVSELLKCNPEIRLVYLGEMEVSGNIVRFLEMLGIPEDHLLHITKPTRFRKVFLPEQGFKSCEWYSAEFLRMLDLIADKAERDTDLPVKWEKTKKIYFTRRVFGKAVASEFGEEYYEQCFSHNGFTILAPEKLTFEDQLYLWNHASDIACINGTIPLNVMFSRNHDLRMTVLNKTSLMHENPYILLRMRHIQAEFIDVYKEPLKGYPKSLGEGPFLLWYSNAFNNYCRRRRFKQPMTKNQCKRYFVVEQIKYYWAVLGLVPALRRKLSAIVPEKVKRIIRQ